MSDIHNLTTKSKFIATNWKPLSGKNTLQGTADIETPSGFVFRSVMKHSRDGKHWVQVPSQQYIKQDGTKSYVPIVEFSSADRWKQFNAACLAAIDELSGGAE